MKKKNNSLQFNINGYFNGWYTIDELESMDWSQVSLADLRTVRPSLDESFVRESGEMKNRVCDVAHEVFIEIWNRGAKSEAV